jgi:hypothetical protein
MRIGGKLRWLMCSGADEFCAVGDCPVPSEGCVAAEAGFPW